MSPQSPRTTAGLTSARARWFPLALGAFLGLSLLKFGNAIIMERQVVWPQDGYEWAIAQWPVVLGYGLLAGVALLGAGVARWQFGGCRWLVLLPLAWFGWQVLAATASVDGLLTVLTLRHFAACVLCFFLGYLALNRTQLPGGFWTLIIAAMFLVIVVGFDQRFRGLAETREFLRQHEQNHWRDLPAGQLAEMEGSGLLMRTAEGYTANPGLLKKAESARISSTLFYPNSLAGAILLLLPPGLVALATSRRLTRGARWFAAGVFGLGALACLYWSGSKAGWLLALGLAGITLLRSPLSRSIKLAVVLGLLLVGLAGFTAKYLGFFQRGATSVVARFDYWRAAWQTAAANPLLGTGPGTFSRSYQQIKNPESEMARLAHNDYLQQASDSGWPGFVFYALWVVGVLAVTGRPAFFDAGWQRFAVWLGTSGWALQSCAEFSLYIPALAWTAFVLLGWLLAGVVEKSSTNAVPGR